MLRAIVAAFTGLLFGATSAWAQCTMPNTLTNGTNADATQVMANLNAILTCINSLPPPSGGLPTAQGRLTLATGTPVMTSAQTGKTTIYYTPYVGNQMLITANGTSFTAMAFAELSNVTTNSSTGNAGPAAVAANSNYDLFVWSNSGTLVLTRGPAWTSDTARSLSIARINGIWTNGSAITNGPAANLGTYVGTVRSNGSAAIDWNQGGIGSGGAAAVLNVWNTYNRVAFSGLVGDSTTSWNYTSNTIRPANNSTTMRASFVQGLQEEAFYSDYASFFSDNTGTASAIAAIGYDSTTASSGRDVPGWTYGTQGGNPFGSYVVQAIGYHYMQALECVSFNSGTITFYGSLTTPTRQTGLIYRGSF